MFPSTGHFRFQPCPYHLEGHCGRVYCHFRHLKTTGHEKKVDDELSELEKEICDSLKIDQDTFNVLVNEEDNNVHERLVSHKLKNKFPSQAKLLDNFHFPEPLDDTDFSSFLTNNQFCESTRSTNETPSDETSSDQFREKGIEQNDVSGHGNRKTTEGRHIIVSGLDKIDKREGHRRSIAQPKTNSNASISRLAPTDAEAEIPENTDDVATQPLYSTDLSNLKQEASDSSESEDNAEVDKILSEMELLNPQLFSSVKADPFKTEPTTFAAEENALSDMCAEKLSVPPSSCASVDNLVGRINLKSIAAINNEFSCTADRSVRMKPGGLYEPAPVASLAVPDPIIVAAALAEQNRLKNVFKNTICSHIDNFFDLSAACKVYGTEIFNLLEPLLNYLIEKLNPEFNYEKLSQMHAQNLSLSFAMPFVTNCDHIVNCVDCHNLLAAALSRVKVRTADEFTQTDANNDTPLRKIKAGLCDITKEMLSLGLPEGAEAASKAQIETKSVQTQTRDRGEHHSSRRRSSHHHSERATKSKDDRHRGKSSSKLDRSDHSAKSSTSEKKREKRRKSDDSDGSSVERRDRSHKHVKSSKTRVSHREKSDHEKRRTSNSDKDTKHKKIKDDSDYDGDDIFGAPLSDGGSDSDAAVVPVSAGGREESKTVSSDSADNNGGNEDKADAKNSSEFTVQYPTTAGKKRVSHVTDSNSSLVNRQTVKKKRLPTPAEVMHQRMQIKAAEVARAEAQNLFSLGGATSEKLRISLVPNVNSILKAKERMQHDMQNQPTPPPPARTIAQTAVRGQRFAHKPVEPPKPKGPAQLARPLINKFKEANNIHTHVRQDALDRLFELLAKKVQPEMARTLAVEEEQRIHERVTTERVYKNSLNMAILRISKETSDKFLVRTPEYPLEVNGLSIYDLLRKYILTKEQLEINGFPLPIPSKSGACYISTKAVHYKPLSTKRNGGSFYCQQCKEQFDMDPKTGLPITPASGCQFHLMRPRKEPGRNRFDTYYPCCKGGLDSEGCTRCEYHTPDTTDDDCLTGYVKTRDAPAGEAGSKRIYSLDCEMCATTVGVELTRVTVIGHDCEIVYDSLVKPRNPILDYCTKFSGITEEKLRNVTKRLEQVREELFKFIFKDTILIGHSLENDLKALKIMHFTVVDTSVMYPHRDAPEIKCSLKTLSQNHIQFLIQDSEFGHDSKEDAVACMKLVWKKIREDAQAGRPKKPIG